MYVHTLPNGHTNKHSVYLHVYIYTYVCIHVYSVYIYICIYICVNMHVCFPYVYIHIQSHTNTLQHIHTTCMYPYGYLHRQLHLYPDFACKNMCGIHVYIYIYIYICVYRVRDKYTNVHKSQHISHAHIHNSNVPPHVYTNEYVCFLG